MIQRYQHNDDVTLETDRCADVYQTNFVITVVTQAIKLFSNLGLQKYFTSRLAPGLDISANAQALTLYTN